MNSREKLRNERLLKIKEWIMEGLKNKNLENEKLIARCMIEFGIENKKAKEYISPFIVLFDLEIKGGKICEKTGLMNLKEYS